MGRIVCAGPNLALERNQRLATLVPGEVLRSLDSLLYASGKGTNVARAVHLLGSPALLVTFAAGELGALAVEMARAEGFEVTAVAIDGVARSTALLLEEDGRVTVVNDAGPPPTDAGWERFIAAAAASLDAASTLVCSGSLPADSPVDAYATLVGVARQRGARVIVDATGAVLASALGARPDLVMPNLFEALACLDGHSHQPSSTEGAEAVDAALAAAGRLLDSGALNAVVTAGALGVAVAAEGRDAEWVDAHRVSVVNPIGAGDALAGALAVELSSGADLLDAVRSAVAVAAASVETRVPGHFDPARAGELRQLGTERRRNRGQ